MAPKRRTVKTVVTSKKVVEETVKVVVTPEGGGGRENEQVEVFSTSTKENKNFEVFNFTTTPDDAVLEPPRRVLKTVSVQEKSPVDDDETQPASEPQTFPEPPKKPAPPTKTERKDEKTKRGAKKSVPEKKSAAASGGDGRKRRRRRGVAGGEGGEGYKRYVFKVMKQVHPDLGISGKAMTVINNYMSDMFERLANEAALLQKYSGKHTMSSREVQGAVKLVLPGELGKHAIAEGTKAINSYVNYGTGLKT